MEVHDGFVVTEGAMHDLDLLVQHRHPLGDGRKAEAVGAVFACEPRSMGRPNER
jgi:hypothetical protein